MPTISITPTTPTPISYNIPERENFKIDFSDSKADQRVMVTRLWGASPDVPPFVLWEGADYIAAGDYTESQIEQAVWDKLNPVI